MCLKKIKVSHYSNLLLLLKKLELIGIRGAALPWFKNYLSEQSQVVSICGMENYTKLINYGFI